MRKLISAGMALVMMVTLAACGQSGSGAASTEAQSSSAVETEAESGEAAEEITGETPADTAEETDGAGAEHNILVAYFSWSGNTQEMASYIAEQTGGDLLEIQPATPYPEDYNECGDVALEERDNNERPAIANLPEFIDQYDAILIGYPIWWGVAAWPVDGFVEANDFTGKTVIPFCTSSSSGLGESGELLAELAGTGDWQEGQRQCAGGVLLRHRQYGDCGGLHRPGHGRRPL